MKLSELKINQFAYSNITQIFYGIKDNKLMKYPTYPKADRVWRVAKCKSHKIEIGLATEKQIYKLQLRNSLHFANTKEPT